MSAVEVAIEQAGKKTPTASSRQRRPHDVLRSMDNCTKCGICQAHCPVAAATADFPGPKYAGPQAQRFRVIGVNDEVSASLCSGCGICSSVCPNDVAISDIITLAKASMVTKKHGVSVGQRLLNRPDTIGRIGSLAPWLGNILLGNRAARRLAEFLFGIDRDAPLPRFAGNEFHRQFESLTQPDGPSIGYFPGCSVTHYDPQTGLAAVRVLNSMGYRVAAPSNGCCALPMLSSGEWGEGETRARALISKLAPMAAGGQTIVSTSTSCSLTLRSKYAAYLDMVDTESAMVATSVSDICGYLLDHHGGELSERFQPVRKRILYHGPCQLRGHHLGQPAAELLSMIPEVDLVHSQADCCGVAGTYGYDRQKRLIADRVGATLIEQVEASKPDLIVCDSETCRWNIAQKTGILCVHPVEIFSESLGLGAAANALMVT